MASPRRGDQASDLALNSPWPRSRDHDWIGNGAIESVTSSRLTADSSTIDAAREPWLSALQQARESHETGHVPALIVDAHEPAELEAALREILHAARQRTEVAAIFVVPFGMTLPPELRRPVPHNPAVGIHGGLSVDRLAHEVFVDGQVVHLTVKEFALLDYLLERRGVVLTRQVLLRAVWGERYYGGTRTVDVHVRRLRRKLGPDTVDTVRGVGYRFGRAHASRTV